jgi:hypothetical protein
LAAWKSITIGRLSSPGSSGALFEHRRRFALGAGLSEGFLASMTTGAVAVLI